MLAQGQAILRARQQEEDAANEQLEIAAYQQSFSANKYSCSSSMQLQEAAQKGPLGSSQRSSNYSNYRQRTRNTQTSSKPRSTSAPEQQTGQAARQATQLAQNTAQAALPLAPPPPPPPPDPNRAQSNSSAPAPQPRSLAQQQAPQNTLLLSRLCRLQS